ATKLDLAKAYEEMGDKDGARELLNEVVREGDGAQQSQANQMLAKLG
ncbi:MAG TPA: FimV/HubP family polar landmark protein, partial [Burkholderiales bacterium]|nr:FimV/HubP family polar landmark protein [Burkholderiales bacterium]